VSAVPAPTGHARPLRVPWSAALWAGFVAVLGLKLAFLGAKGTNDMDTALGWGHALLAHGLVAGYSGSNFPIAFQLYEGLVAFADWAGIREYAAMKGLDLLCDLATFWLLRVLLRRRGLDPAWAFLYWISPYFLVMSWLGYDHFQLGLLVVGCLVLLDAGRLWWASLVLGIAFVQRPQAQVLVAALVVYAAVALLRGRRDEARPALVMLVGPAVLWCGYALWFLAGGKDAFFLVRSYGEISAFSPALSANMLNVWGVVGELYRKPGEQLYQVTGPQAFHTIAALVGGALLLAGTWAIARRAAERPFSDTVTYLFALGAILLPNVYTRAHDPHFFLGAVLVVPLVAALRERRPLLLAVLGAYLLLQAMNSFGIYGFGQTALSYHQPFDAFEHFWTFRVRAIASGISTVLFVAMAALLWPQTRRRLAASGAPAR
jgi:hypothetical protein